MARRSRFAANILMSRCCRIRKSCGGARPCNSASSTAFVTVVGTTTCVMMNNDTLIEPDYVTTLVRVSQEQNAAVGGAIVDSANPSRVLDAGEFIDWNTYSFPVKTVREPGETYVDEVDLLSGRGTLVPLRMVRQAGNVNGARFPHYIADCEFFSRLKRNGFRLGVTWDAVIRSHVGVTGLSTHHADPLTFAEVWQALFSRRSMDNVGNHWRFIEDCAPIRYGGD